MEIREPFGSGIVKFRGIEAIRQNPPRGIKALLNRVIPQTPRSSQELRASNNCVTTPVYGWARSGVKHNRKQGYS